MGGNSSSFSFDILRRKVFGIFVWVKVLVTPRFWNLWLRPFVLTVTCFLLFCFHLLSHCQSSEPRPPSRPPGPPHRPVTSTRPAHHSPHLNPRQRGPSAPEPPPPMTLWPASTSPASGRCFSKHHDVMFLSSMLFFVI